MVYKKFLRRRKESWVKGINENIYARITKIKIRRIIKVEKTKRIFQENG